MFSGEMPNAFKKPTQNWCVDQMLRTFGMPTRIWERSFAGLRAPLVAAEGFFANQVGNIRVGILGPLDSSLNDLHFVQVFHQPFRARVVDDDALPTWSQRNLAPRTSFPFGQLDVNKAALAVHRTPVADGIHGRARFIGQRLNGAKTAKTCTPSAAPPIECDQRRANRSGLPGVRVYYHFRFRDLRVDEIYLRLHHRQISVRSTLQDVFPSGLLQVVQPTGVDPNVQRQNATQTGKNLLRLPSFTLLIHDITLQKHATSHGQLGHSLRAESGVSHLVHGNVKAFGNALQEGPVARGTLRIQPEVGNRRVVENHDLHIDAANIANAVSIGEKVKSGGCVGNGLDHRTVGTKNSLE